MRPLDLEQVAALRDALPPRWQAIVSVGFGAGLRSGEALGLTVDRVDFLRRTLTVDQQLVTPKAGAPHLATPKTAASRLDVPLPDYVVESLSAHLAQFPAGVHGLIFTGERGQPKRRTRFSDMWRLAVERGGLPAGTRFHDLRHTYASLLIRAGCSVKVVQARLGHATAQETLETYAHLCPDDDDRTRAAVDRAIGAAVDHRWTKGAVHLG